MIAKFGMKAKEQSHLNILILLTKKELKSNGEHESKHPEYSCRQTCRLGTEKPGDLNLELFVVRQRCEPLRPHKYERNWPKILGEGT